MKWIASVVLGLALASTGCSDGSKELGVSSSRVDEWAQESGASEAQKKSVEGLLRTGTSAKASAAMIEDPKRRAAVEARIERQVKELMGTMNGAGAELFAEAGLLKETGK